MMGDDHTQLDTVWAHMEGGWQTYERVVLGDSDWVWRSKGLTSDAPPGILFDTQNKYNTSHTQKKTPCWSYIHISDVSSNNFVRWDCLRRAWMSTFTSAFVTLSVYACPIPFCTVLLVPSCRVCLFGPALLLCNMIAMIAARIWLPACIIHIWCYQCYQWYIYTHTHTHMCI